MVVKNIGLQSPFSSTQPFYPLDAFYTLWKTSHLIEKTHRWVTQQFFTLSFQTAQLKKSSPLYQTLNGEGSTTSLFIRLTAVKPTSPPPLAGRMDSVNYMH